METIISTTYYDFYLLSNLLLFEKKQKCWAIRRFNLCTGIKFTQKKNSHKLLLWLLHRVNSHLIVSDAHKPTSM